MTAHDEATDVNAAPADTESDDPAADHVTEKKSSAAADTGETDK